MEIEETKGCGKISRLEDGFGIACGEVVGEQRHQYLCKECQEYHKGVKECEKDGINSL